MVLFVLTFVATKAGRRQKADAGLAESGKGRNAAQIIANLGAAGLFAAYGRGFVEFNFDGPLVMLLAALAEATADTVSSEIGSAFGGRPVLVTTLRRVEAGTDGAVSLVGTVAGVAGALVVVAAGVWAMGLSWKMGAVALLGGVVGLGFDSLLGATVERRGWVGNDWVNFLSTVCAGAVAWGIALIW